VVAWSDLTKVGSDALLVRSSSVLRPEVAPVDRNRLVSRLGDRPVLTESGRRVGRISDYDIDEETGRIVRYHIPEGGLLAHLRHQTISFGPEAVRTFGSDAILVADDALPAGEEVDRAKAS
jgi:sporulation protein YlmC with PRC-barrel domain